MNFCSLWLSYWRFSINNDPVILHVSKAIHTANTSYVLMSVSIYVDAG